MGLSIPSHKSASPFPISALLLSTIVSLWLKSPPYDVGAEDEDGELGLFRRLLVFDDSMTPLIIDISMATAAANYFLVSDGDTDRAVNKAGKKSVSLEQLCNNTEESCEVYHSPTRLL
eukprot:scaffold38648_cov128-Skeletonema_dohrnii-CCMP3373.AAC.1